MLIHTHTHLTLTPEIDNLVIKERFEKSLKQKSKIIFFVNVNNVVENQCLYAS
jgi:hypothetical protein